MLLREDVFDVVAVVVRARAMDTATASDAELAWADQAADRIRGWVDAWQAEVQFEQTLPRPLPPLPADPGDAPADHPDDDAASGADDGSSGAGRDPDGAGDDPAADGDGGGSSGGDAGDGSGSPRAGSGENELPSLGSGRSAPESVAEQARKARRSWLLSRLSTFAEALRAGRITSGHVDALATAADRLPPAVRDRLLARGDELLRGAAGMTVERFTRVIAKMVSKAFEEEGIDRHAAQRARSGLRRGIDQATKMHWYRVELDPERGAILDGQLQAEREAIFRSGGHRGLRGDQLELLALLNLVGPPHRASAGGATTANGQPVTGPASSNPAAAAAGPDANGAAGIDAAAGASAARPRRGRRASTKQVRGLVLIDATTWISGVHGHTVCENGAGVPLPPEAVRRLLCIAQVTYGITINGRLVAQVANNELATPDQRDGLRSMYRTCAGPGCMRTFDHCQIHHIIARARNGPTDIALMIPLCQAHHDAIHHRDWQVAIDPGRNLTWTAPDGRQQFCPYVPLADLDGCALPAAEPTQPALFTPDAA